MSRDQVDYFFEDLNMHLSMGKPPQTALIEAVEDYASVYHSKEEGSELAKAARVALKQLEEEDQEAYWKGLRKELNRIHSLLSGKPKEYKYGYWLTPGSILSAYREADITWEEACNLLEVKK